MVLVKYLLCVILTLAEWISLFIDRLERFLFTLISIFLRIEPLPRVDRSRSAVIVTFAHQGIGRYLAFKLSDRGYTVFAMVSNTDESIELLEGWKKRTKTEKMRGKLLPLVWDASSSTRRDATLTVIREILTEERWRLHALINCGTTGRSMLFSASTYNCIRQVFDDNYFTPLDVTRDFLSLLLRIPGGRVLHMGSIAGFTPLPVMGLISSTKAALNMTSRVMMTEMSPLGLSVSNIEAGLVLAGDPFYTYSESNGHAEDSVKLEDNPDTWMTADDVGTAEYHVCSRLRYFAGFSSSYGRYARERGKCGGQSRTHSSHLARVYSVGMDTKMMRMIMWLLGNNLGSLVGQKVASFI
ncbi:estradiol 17-beta-dehydrogenase 2 [Planoprotostelium fungivorum]|uniref:Estradiol 17-beta-dehydrogenase 2 n=1 Tax=Planoprotostelium fungivorum TaxID=1890364 RepID=A0A2P6NZN7_9EUKA|nr:estradiol 17-beta-dehydrogenase 2 [Planoprotostelium fungivorum]